MLGEVPLGVTGVVAVEVPLDALRPLPASKWTHNIPLTGSSDNEERPPLVPDREDRPGIDVPEPGSPGFSILYFKNSAGLMSSCLCPLGRVPLGVGTGLGAAPDLTESRSRSCRIRRMEGERDELNAVKCL
jgi:hypothetical protein